MQNRFQSWALWLAVSALVGFVLKMYLKIEIAQYDTLVNLILVVLSGFGIINNPENKNSL